MRAAVEDVSEEIITTSVLDTRALSNKVLKARVQQAIQIVQNSEQFPGS